MRQLLVLLCALTGALAFGTPAAGPRRVLIIATNHAQLNGQTTGTFMMEIALPIAVFVAAGVEFDVATPLGGSAAIYHAGKMWPALTAATELPAYQEKTSRTLRPDEIDPARYRAVFYPGGHGQFFDVALSPILAARASEIHAAGGAIATAGHGSAILATLQQPDGRPFAAGKRIAPFPTWAEREWMKLSDFGKLLPFDLEEVLRAQGATLQVPVKGEPSANAVVADREQRLFTGSFATNAETVAQLVVAFLNEPARPR